LLNDDLGFGIWVFGIFGTFGILGFWVFGFSGHPGFRLFTTLRLMCATAHIKSNCVQQGDAPLLCKAGRERADVSTDEEQVEPRWRNTVERVRAVLCHPPRPLCTAKVL
jgi:hypothetical protein